MARSYGVAICLAGDSAYPQIADVTADFVYARIMGTVDKEPLGYGARQLDQWAAWADGWAKGVAPMTPVALTAVRAAKKPRDVFLYVIRGNKLCNPAAAIMLINRLE